MIIKSVNESVRKYTDTVEIIAKEFENSLNNKALFMYKLSILKVMLLPTSTNDIPTSGLCKKSGDNLSILIFVNENDPIDYIEFVIAHEFAHLLFKKMTDLLNVTGIVEDNSTELTSIIRIAKGGKEYGRELEEQLADILAIFILKKRGIAFSEKLRDDLKKTQTKREFVISFTDVFGKNLFECEKIDEFVLKSDASVFLVSNSFWYCAVTFALPQVIAVYNKAMGRNSWKTFCDALDKSEFIKLEKQKEKFDKVA